MQSYRTCPECGKPMSNFDLLIRHVDQEHHKIEHAFSYDPIVMKPKLTLSKKINKAFKEVLYMVKQLSRKDEDSQEPKTNAEPLVLVQAAESSITEFPEEQEEEKLSRELLKSSDDPKKRLNAMQSIEDQLKQLQTKFFRIKEGQSPEVEDPLSQENSVLVKVWDISVSREDLSGLVDGLQGKHYKMVSMAYNKDQLSEISLMVRKGFVGSTLSLLEKDRRIISLGKIAIE